MLFSGNDFLKVMVFPELGGRIQRAYDKTNDYDFVYYNHVIKPALVGLTGPGSPEESSLTGRSTIAPALILLWTIPSAKMKMALLLFLSARQIKCTVQKAWLPLPCIPIKLT